MHSWRSSSFKLKFCSAYQDDLWFAPFLLSLKSPHTTKSVGSFRSPSFFFCSSCTSYMVEKTVSERTTYGGRGQPRKPRPAPLYSVKELIEAQPASAWQTIGWTEGTKGTKHDQGLAL